MGLTRVLGAWVAVWAVLLGWRAMERLVRRPGGAGAGPVPGGPGPLALEALLLTLLGGLWFASLGSGGGWLVFLLVGLLMELPHRLRAEPGRGAIRWKPVAGGVVRVMSAGLVCGLVMGM